MSNLCYLIRLLQLFPVCFIYTPSFILSIFVALSNFRRLIKHLSFSPLCYLLTFYVIYAPYKCTCCTHTQLLLPSYWAHVLCANTVSQLNMRLWPSCHSDVGRSGHRWGFSLRAKWYPSLALLTWYKSRTTILGALGNAAVLWKPLAWISCCVFTWTMAYTLSNRVVSQIKLFFIGKCTYIVDFRVDQREGRKKDSRKTDCRQTVEEEGPFRFVHLQGFKKRRFLKH